MKQRDQWFHKGNLRHLSYITAFKVSEDTLLNGSWFHDLYFLAGMKIQQLMQAGVHFVVIFLSLILQLETLVALVINRM